MIGYEAGARSNFFAGDGSDSEHRTEGNAIGCAGAILRSTFREFC